MHFAFTEEQQSIAEAIEAVLSTECTPDVVRAAEHERPTQLWATLAEVGLFAVNLPEEAGGLDLGMTDLLLALERCGYHAVPLPITDAVALGPVLPEAAEVAEGTVRVCISVGGLAQDADLADIPTVLHASGLARAAGPLTRQASVDRARWVFSGLQPGEALAGAAAGVRQRATLATAAQLLGGARRMLDMATAYAKARRQFGKPIGAQQAVQHRLADALLALSFATPAVHRAALSIDGGTATLERDLSMAKAMASEAARTVRGAALQVHGAIGYTIECDLQLWLTRSIALESLWGSAGFHRSRVADHLDI